MGKIVGSGRYRGRYFSKVGNVAKEVGLLILMELIPF